MIGSLHSKQTETILTASRASVICHHFTFPLSSHLPSSNPMGQCTETQGRAKGKDSEAGPTPNVKREKVLSGGRLCGKEGTAGTIRCPSKKKGRNTGAGSLPNPEVKSHVHPPPSYLLTLSYFVLPPSSGLSLLYFSFALVASTPSQSIRFKGETSIQSQPCSSRSPDQAD